MSQLGFLGTALTPISPHQHFLEAVLKTPSSAGATVVDNADFPAADDFKKLNQLKGTVKSSEFKTDIARYIQTLERNPNNLHSAVDIIEFTKSFPAEEYPEKQIGEFLWTHAGGLDVNSEKYAEMVK